jgi:hypothetical protein
MPHSIDLDSRVRIGEISLYAVMMYHSKFAVSVAVVRRGIAAI